MTNAIEAKHKPKQAKGWLTQTTLALFAVATLGGLTGCVALKNSADTIGNAAGSQVTKAGLWVVGKDADCNFTARNTSRYNPQGGSASGTITNNTCRELPSTAAQIKLAEQQEAVFDAHLKAQQRRLQQAQDAQTADQNRRNELARTEQALQRAEMMERQAVDTCHRREIDLLAQGKKLDPAEGCATILEQDKVRTAELLSKTKAPAKKPTGFWSGWTLKD